MPPSNELSKTQVDRLGDSLRRDDISEDDLRLLDAYRRSFMGGYEDVVGRIRDELNLEPTGRPAKSTTSISEKLRRESIRLSQVQDIAGCRLVVADLKDQDDIVERLKRLFDKITIVDRRQQPSHGYRAVHVIAHSQGKLVEIQVRTSLQHLWAELSEKLSDVVDNGIKYGVGDKDSLLILAIMSNTIMKLEINESMLHQIVTRDELKDKLSEDIDPELIKAQQLITLGKQSIVELLNEAGEVIPREKGQKDAVSD